MYDVPTLTETQREEVRRRLETWGWEEAHRRLIEADPALSKRIHVNDHYRIRRAWEILSVTQKTPSTVETTPAPLDGRRLLKVGLDAERDVLLNRIRTRVHAMLAEGWIDEVEAVLKCGYTGWSALNSVGYKEIVEHLRAPMQKKHS